MTRRAGLGRRWSSGAMRDCRSGRSTGGVPALSMPRLGRLRSWSTGRTPSSGAARGQGRGLGQIQRNRRSIFSRWEPWCCRSSRGRSPGGSGNSYRRRSRPIRSRRLENSRSSESELSALVNRTREGSTPPLATRVRDAPALRSTPLSCPLHESWPLHAVPYQGVVIKWAAIVRG